MFFQKQRLGIIILFLSDIVMLFLTLAIVIEIRGALPTIFPSYAEVLIKFEYFWWFFPVWIATMTYDGAYTKKFTSWDEVKLLWKSSFFSTVAILTLISLGKLSYPLSRTFILLTGLLSLVIFPCFRILAKQLIVRAGLLKSKVLIIGTNDIAQRTAAALKKESNMGYEVVGFIDDYQSINKKDINGIKVHDHLDKIERYLTNCDIQEVVIAIQGIDKAKLAELINKLQHKTRSVLYIPDFSGMAVIGTELLHFFHDQFLAVEIKNNLARPFNYVVKKIFDYSVGTVLFLFLFIPIMIISAIIKLTSSGPAIFTQERVGKDGKLFKCYKFRTMHQDAEEKLAIILKTDLAARAEWDRYWKLKNDPRITKIGAFLRKTSLDEIPQIFNVLKGDMSLVGPRPVPKDEMDKYDAGIAETYWRILPGITGLWQVSGRSDTTYEQRASLGSWYVRNWNLWLDIVILLKTFYVVLKKEGAH